MACCVGDPILKICSFDRESGGREETVIVKTAPKSRLENERDILRHFQHRAPSLRPLIDEIQDPPDPPSIVLKYLDDNLLRASNAKRLTGTEIKYVAKRVLEALEVLHEDGYVHTGRRPVVAISK